MEKIKIIYRYTDCSLPIPDVITSLMFNHFKLLHEKQVSSGHHNRSETKKIIEMFSNIMNSLRSRQQISDGTMYGEEIGFSEADLERLSDMSAIVSLHSGINGMIEQLNIEMTLQVWKHTWENFDLVKKKFHEAFNIKYEIIEN